MGLPDEFTARTRCFLEGKGWVVDCTLYGETIPLYVPLRTGRNISDHLYGLRAVLTPSSGCCNYPLENFRCIFCEMEHDVEAMVFYVRQDDEMQELVHVSNVISSLDRTEEFFEIYSVFDEYHRLVAAPAFVNGLSAVFCGDNYELWMECTETGFTPLENG